MIFNNRIKNIIIILEGFACLIVAHLMLWLLINPMLYKLSSSIPQITKEILSSSAFSPIIAIIYCYNRTKRLPVASPHLKDLVMTIIVGIILSWLTFFLNMITSDKKIPFAQSILDVPTPFLYLNIFLVVLWGPTLEEVLFRGYFFGIIREDWGDIFAFILSSLLFIIPHGIWGTFDINLFFIFLYSAIFTVVYSKSGIVASITVHSLVNAFLLLANT